MGHQTAAGCMAVCLFALACLLAGVSAQDPYTGFIRVSNGRFVDATCREFLFSGWNGWNIIEAAANKMTFPGHPDGKAYIVDMFQRARGHALNLMRFFLAGDDNYNVFLMEKPGVYNEEAFQALDFVLDEASKAGIKLILVPLNLWKRNNGVPQFEEWCGSNLNTTKPPSNMDPRSESSLQGMERLQTPYDWFVNPACRQIYKDYLKGIVERVNSINGVPYRDDPTIFAINLINEPRCKFCGPEAINDWIADIAQYLKSIAPNHMATTGEEGFFDSSDPFEGYNPSGSWADHTGQDFRANHASEYIDFAVMHMWPDNWADYSLEFGYNWITSHIQAAQELGKPLVLEEYGKNSPESEIEAVRDPWFRLAQDLTEDNLASGGPLRGVLFWEWDSDGTGPRDGSASTVRDYDSTIKNEVAPFSHRIAANSTQMHRSGSGAVPGCTPASLGVATSAQPSANAGTVVAGRKLLVG